jgi:hypothetical protein
VSARFATWPEAHAAAVAKANATGLCVGIRRQLEYGRDGYNVALVPRDGHRYGHDAACEIVRPGDPA